MDVLLHSAGCACRGTGWIAYPGVGAKAMECDSDNQVSVPGDEWERLGRPQTIEEYRERKGGA